MLESYVQSQWKSSLNSCRLICKVRTVLPYYNNLTKIKYRFDFHFDWFCTNQASFKSLVFVLYRNEWKLMGREDFKIWLQILKPSNNMEGQEQNKRHPCFPFIFRTVWKTTTNSWNLFELFNSDLMFAVLKSFLTDFHTVWKWMEVNNSLKYHTITLKPTADAVLQFAEHLRCRSCRIVL